MRSGICPKCGANDIRLEAGRWSYRNFLTLGCIAWHGSLRIRNLVCASCGYLENYIRPEDMETVTRILEPYNPPSPPPRGID